MTWKEIKAAVENAGITERDNLVSIECERRDGDKKLHVARSGAMFQLREHLDVAKADAHGCAT
ncbi:MAG: hypothetical protein ACKVRN_14630 [Pyrinomonadaceae bacterium]